MSGWKPRARTTDRVVEALDDEVLVYDTVTLAAHCLRPEAAAVWRACDGATTVAGIARTTSLDAGLVERVLVQLAAADLVDRDGLLSRRAAIVAAASGVAFVTSIAVPRAASAASCVPSNGACAGLTCCLGLACIQVGPIRICL